jgi:hypothetical protein
MMAVARRMLHIDMRQGLRIDISSGSKARAFLELNGPIIRMLRPDHRRRLMKECLFLGGERWRTHWMPLRFTPESPVIVHNTSRWERLKTWQAGRQLPQFVGLTPWRGGSASSKWWGRNKAKMIVNVFKTARSKYHPKGPNAGSVIVRMSYGHGIRPEKAMAFKTIAPMEWDDIQGVMVGYLAEQITGVQSYKVRRAGMLSGSANKAVRNVAGIDYNKWRNSAPRVIGYKLGKGARDVYRSHLARTVGV